MNWLTEAMIGEMERTVYKSGGSMITSNQFFNGIHYPKGEPVVVNNNEFNTLFKIKLKDIQQHLKKGTLVLDERAQVMLDQLLSLPLQEFTINAPSEHFLEPFVDNLIIRFLYFFNTKTMRAIHFLRMDGQSLIQAMISFSRLYKASDSKSTTESITENEPVFELAG